MKGLTGYFVLFCVPVVLLASAGVWYVAHVQRETERRHYESWMDRARRAATSVNPDRPTRYPTFAWRAGKGLVSASQLDPALERQLSALKTWPLEKKKKSRTAIGAIGPFVLAWRSEGKTVIGCVMDPYESDATVFGSAFVTGLCFAGIVLFAALGTGGWGLAHAAHVARREDARKTAFVSDVTHELKIPLASVRIWSEMLRAGRVPAEKIPHACEVIAAENGRMIRLVENLLDFGRLEAGRRVYVRETLSLDGLAREVAALFPETEITLSGTAACTGDADAVRRILVNLVGNAVKYAPGALEIVISDSGAADVSLAVRDRGPGMTEEGYRHCFDRYWRAEDEATAATGGFGLGLAISRALAHGMGGELTVAPREGGGCAFTLTLGRAAEAS